MTAPSLIERVDAICGEAATDLPRDFAATAKAIQQRLHEPLRIALAGRVKAGKSTLLNALIGERLAPTDAGECTRLVTWYRYNDGYSVAATLGDGTASKPPFRRSENALHVEIPDPDAVTGLQIGWPSRHLRSATYIDTPGLGSLSTGVSGATRDFLGVEIGRPGQADAVIYLMRHAHAEDAGFLEGFRDAGLPVGSPVNTIAVLSRADEIGGGRLDAMRSAARIAGRYRSDSRVRGLAGTIIPMAGLLAETAATLEESEYASLRELAASDGFDHRVLLSVDRFRDPDRNSLTTELRERLLQRFGLFGLRFSIAALREGSAPTSQHMVRLLLDLSGIAELRATIASRLTSRAQPLVARSALAELRALARVLSDQHSGPSTRLEGAVEEVLASAHEFAQLELLHSIGAGLAEFTSAEAEEAAKLAGGGSIQQRLSLPPESSRAMLEAEVIAAIERWRQRGANPFANRETARGCEVMARSYERQYVEIQSL